VEFVAGAIGESTAAAPSLVSIFRQPRAEPTKVLSVLSLARRLLYGISTRTPPRVRIGFGAQAPIDPYAPACTHWFRCTGAQLAFEATP